MYLPLLLRSPLPFPSSKSTKYRKQSLFTVLSFPAPPSFSSFFHHVASILIHGFAFNTGQISRAITRKYSPVALRNHLVRCQPRRGTWRDNEPRWGSCARMGYIGGGGRGTGLSHEEVTAWIGIHIYIYTRVHTRESIWGEREWDRMIRLKDSLRL